MNLVLASASPFRSALLNNAGLEFEAVAAKIDERAVEQPLLEAGLPPADIAEVLAIAKAEDVSARNTGALVIGSDQVLSLDGEILHKVADMEGARRRLLQLSAKTHHLDSAIALVRDGEVLWSHVERAALTMRSLSPEFVGRHLAEAGDTILSSVGAYQIEGVGIQLFEKIDGDLFTIMGLPLLPLLAELRRQAALEG
ncbi:Maf-like protein [Salaquimonas pukyongi]|uniref:Maf-like protein n=1 Tax=Salaquimonas pukyongi TaxID=2712698 RepID=UPI00096BC0C9|nr:Maf-like protein [Salaquimonas pukyongi]